MIGLLTDVNFASPKSRILACPRLVMKMLAGLMSRWTIPSCDCSGRTAASGSNATGYERFMAIRQSRSKGTCYSPSFR